MKKIIAIANQKGGVSKTTTAQILATGLSKYGPTLAIDLDTQGNLSFFMGIAERESDLYEALMGNISVTKTIYNIEEDLYLIPASPNLNELNRLSGKKMNLLLKDMLQPIMKDFDYIVIDTPPALSTITMNALAAATHVVIPALADMFSYHAIEDIVMSINSIKEINPSVKIEGILLTQFNGRLNLEQGMLEGMEEKAAEIGTKVFAAKIPKAIAVREAQFYQKPLYRYAPKGKVTEAYNSFINEVLEGR